MHRKHSRLGNTWQLPQAQTPNNSSEHEADSKVKILILAYYDGIGKINYVGSTSSSILQWMQKSDIPWLPWERLRGGQYREWNRVLSFTVLRRMEGKKDLKIYYYWKCDEGILNMCMIWSVRHIGCGSQNQIFQSIYCIFQGCELPLMPIVQTQQ